MQANQDQSSQGLSRSDATNPVRASSICRVQTAGRDNITDARTYNRGIISDELSMPSSGLEDSVSTILEGFASPTWQPHSYQARGIEWLTHRISAALFFAPGLGKTSIALGAIKLLQTEQLAKRVLVLAPLTVCITTWDSEPKKWRQFQNLKIGLAHGLNKQAILKDPKYDIVVMNYDGLAWAAPLLTKGHHFDILLCDELTRLKHTSSKRFKLLKPLLLTFKFRWGLTGTPVANGLLDLFGQVFVLDTGARLGRYITHFRAKYFYQESWDQYRYYITPEKAQLLTDQITDIAMYIDPKEYLELPGLLNVPITVQLDDMVQYKALRDDFILRMQNEVITAVNAGVLTNKLRQFTGGAIYLEDAAYKVIGKEKITALESLVEEMSGEPLLVAYQFNHELERLSNAFPSAPAIKGGMTPHQVQEIVSNWNSGSIPVLFVQPSAGAHGINLQFGGSAVCWFSMTYNLEEYIQLIARIYRQGQTGVVRNYTLIARGTIDEVLVKILTAKDVTQESVFQALKFYTGEISGK